MADGEVIRDVVLRLHLKQMPVKIDVPDVTPIKQAANEYAGSIKDAAEKSSKEATASASAIISANLQAVDSYRMMADGAFKVARGLAFLGVAEDENFRKTLQTLAVVQGSFDVYRGLTDIVKGLANAYRAKAAAEAAGAAVTATATATTATAATATTASTASVGGLVAVMNPLALAVAAVVAVFALYWQWTSKLKKETEDFAKQQQDLMRTTAALNSELAKNSETYDSQLRALKPLGEQISDLTDKQNAFLANSRQFQSSARNLSIYDERSLEGILAGTSQRKDQISAASVRGQELLRNLENSYAERERSLVGRLDFGEQSLLNQYANGNSLTNPGTQDLRDLQELRKEREASLKAQSEAMREIIDLERRSSEEVLRLRNEIERRKIEAGL